MKENWILCSERLPEKDGTYLCTMDGELIGEERVFTSMRGFYNGKWDDEGYVIAWQELPEPCDTTDYFSDKFAQAKEVLKSTLDREEMKYPRVACYCDALTLAVEVLDKQIAEKPILDIKPTEKYERTYHLFCLKEKNAQQMMSRKPSSCRCIRSVLNEKELLSCRYECTAKMPLKKLAKKSLKNIRLRSKEVSIWNTNLSNLRYIFLVILLARKDCVTKYYIK